MFCAVQVSSTAIVAAILLRGSGSSLAKVRRLRRLSDRLPTVMAATGEGGERDRRKRRAWRQPRHEAGAPPSVAGRETTAAANGGSSSLDGCSIVQTAGDETTRTNLACEPPPLQRGSCDLPPSREQQEQQPVGQGCGENPPSPPESLVEIDGSTMEGGGQILRNAVTLACLMRRPLRVVKVRGGRSKPGLRPQHLAGLNLIGQLCGGKLVGDTVNSTTVEFWPGSVRNGDYTADTQTAGSTTLLLQVSLPCLLFAPPTSSSTLTLRGGTNADMAPPIDYIIKVFRPTAEKFGVHFDCELKKRGFYPRGGGEVIVRPHPLRNITAATITDPGEVVSVSIHSFVAGTMPEKVARQMAQTARTQVEKQLPGVPVEVDVVTETANTAYGNGSGIMVVAETSTGCRFGGSANGKREEPPYKSGRAAADQVLKAVKEGSCVDEYMQDQLILLMALAKGKSSVRTGPLSLHTKTAIHIARTLTSAVFNVRRLDGGAHLIECEGVGLESPL